VTDFAFIHGGFHGAWCWERVRAELDARGHRTVAMDLPCADLDATLGSHRDFVVESTADLERPVVVAHSYGGLIGPLVVEPTHATRLVHLNAVMPHPRRTLADVMASEPTQRDRVPFEYVDHGDGTHSFPAERARDLFYHDCDDATADWALSQLRPQTTHLSFEPWPLDAWPDVPFTYIVSREDRLLDPEWSRAAAARVGGEVVEINGSHSSFLAQPATLATVLELVART
jgi:pimeloyl-ACP methyl ester carboxylesterase